MGMFAAIGIGVQAGRRYRIPWSLRDLAVQMPMAQLTVQVRVQAEQERPEERRVLREEQELQPGHEFAYREHLPDGQRDRHRQWWRVRRGPVSGRPRPQAERKRGGGLTGAWARSYG